MAVLHPLLTTAIRAARRAGAIISRASLDLESVSVSKKRKNDYVTEVDRSAEQTIVEILAKAYPDHAILAEESGKSGPKEAEFVWIIDPLDGTTNFIHGFPQYCVSIAVSHRGTLQHGCIFDPIRNELFTTSRGRGAYLNERRIRVSRRAQLAECLVGTGFPNRPGQNLEGYLAMYGRVCERAAALRRTGSAALDLAYVACGRLDAFWEVGLMPWDIAAGALLVLEAGGLVSDLDEAETYLETGNIVCSTPKVFVQMLSALGGLPSDEPPSRAV
jgi:myo-inositol-1(or 4)-monophosphatase